MRGYGHPDKLQIGVKNIFAVPQTGHILIQQQLPDNIHGLVIAIGTVFGNFLPAFNVFWQAFAHSSAIR